MPKNVDVKKEGGERASKAMTERSYGSFQRTFRMPPGTDTEKVSAKFAKGVLHIKLPKTKEAQRRSRKVPVASG